MGFWRSSRDEYEKMAEIIAEEPGITQSELARRLGVSVSTVGWRLPRMAEAGVLLSEDDRGGLSLFGREK